ncbi:hypothetical protein ACFYXH_40865 [Streptomyces sp. NPDC002730]|uniref:hypothetical protein n=1 Tax=Streptomyces sp. NPDC002730 TaxID=3364662 RepID=UPI0036988AD7
MNQHTARAAQYLTPAEAIRLKAGLTDWFATEHPIRARVAGLPEHGAALWPARWPQASFPERVALYQSEDLFPPAAAWQNADIIYADPAMCDMVTATAQTFPEQRVQREEFLASIGFLFFAKPVPAEAFGSPTAANAPISAITWFCADDGLSSLAWFRRPAAVYDMNAVKVALPGLHPSKPYDLLWDSPAAHGTHNISLLRALSALAKQPLTNEDTPKIHQSVRGIARRARIRPESFRRIALRRPETASYEVAAARAVAEGRTPAGHWVRGHWRRQYYASINEHRTIWIEGFPRGDFTLPAPIGEKLLIANGDRAHAAGQT